MITKHKQQCEEQPVVTSKKLSKQACIYIAKIVFIRILYTLGYSQVLKLIMKLIILA